MNKNILEKILKKTNVKRGTVFICTFIFLYFVLFTSLITQKYNLTQGDIAKVDIKAPREITDDVATKGKIEQAIKSVPLQYNKNPEVKNKVIDNVNFLFNEVTKIKETTVKEQDKINTLKGKFKIGLYDEDWSILLNLNDEDLKKLKVFLSESMSKLYDNVNISDSNEKNNKDDIKKAQEFIQLKINESNLPKKTWKEIVANIAYSEIKPNFFYDEEKTEELREQVRKKPPVTIKKDQIIVKEGEPVTKNQIDILDKLGLLNSNEKPQIYIYLSLGALISLIMAIQWVYLYKLNKSIYNDISKLILINMLTCISIALARIFSIKSFLIPLACVPMLFNLLINNKLNLIINGLNCILISCAVEFNIEITILALMDVILVSIILKKMQQRNDILYSALYISIINGLLTFSAGVLLSNNTIQVGKRAFFALAGGIISGVITIGLLPFLESTFDIVTTIKLLELSNPNNPLLKKLLVEAPGTYHHSVLVGNLAEVAAEEVGGNPVLARVAAYYHDVGKLKRPYFFKENQVGSENPHDNITPNLSTLIILSHVKDGVEIAKEYKIPVIIRDVIKQHHGTTLVKYFYLTVKNSSENPNEVNEEDFRYPGPRPKMKEAAIIMLADGVEAAVRSINQPTKDKIQEMINKIIQDRITEGQLDNCELTLKDLDIIRKTFIKVLMGIYHQRIEYPTDKWIDKNKRKDNR